MRQHWFDPRRFHDAAVAWSAADQPEEHLRSAVSRAYYACFHLARLGLERGGRWSAGTVNAHGAVIQELRRRGRQDLAGRLRDLKDLRELADYDLDVPVDGTMCQAALTMATALVRLLDRF